ncbi:MAG: glycosyltransferase [Atopobiaceae bacterium]|nr:glycosyltransferase [Atopobiaceae bacterium]
MRVSVLIPTYNRKAFLAEALDSVREQTFTDVEVIVWDDGSTDGTPELLRSIPGIRYVLAPHKGVSYARNQLVALAQGEFIAFLDADDVWLPQKLEKQVAYLDEHPETLLVMTEAELFLDDSVSEPDARQKELLEAEYDYLLPSALIRREAFERFGTFNESFPKGEDSEWLLRLAVGGVSIEDAVHEVLYRYRIHGSNTTVEVDRTGREYLRTIAAAARANRRGAKDAGSGKGDASSAETLTVVIPAYNAEAYLAEAVSSVRAQELPEGIGGVEIIVIDEGSTDGTCALAKSLEADAVFEQQHLHAARARNLGIRNARGSLVMLLDADDVLADGAFMALCTPLVEDRSLRASFGMVEDFLSPELEPDQLAGVSPRAEAYGGIVPGAACFRREVFAREAAGPFDESLQSGETVAWLLRFRDRGLASTNVDDVTLKRRIHLTNTGRIAREAERRNYAALLRARLKKRG